MSNTTFDAVAHANANQLDKAKRMGWTWLFWNCQSSPNMGKWGGHRARLYGCPPEKREMGDKCREIVPDFFDEVIDALDAEYPI
jgi:hypothetical protein